MKRTAYAVLLLSVDMDGEDYAEARSALESMLRGHPAYKWVVPLLGNERKDRE